MQAMEDIWTKEWRRSKPIVKANLLFHPSGKNWQSIDFHLKIIYENTIWQKIKQTELQTNVAIVQDQLEMIKSETKH